MARYPKKTRRSAKSRSYKKKSRPQRNMFSNSGGTSFSIARHYTLSANGSGQLFPVFALGNVALMGPRTTKHDAANTVHTGDDTAWPDTIDRIRSCYNTMRVLSHTITLAPVCQSGDQASVPIEQVYQKFAVDNATTATHCQALTGYGSASHGKLLMPMNQRMPILKHTAYPSKSSIGDVQKYAIPASTTQQVLVLDGAGAGGVNSAHTLGFLKLYAEGLGVNQDCYQVIEKITIQASDRKV